MLKQEAASIRQSAAPKFSGSCLGMVQAVHVSRKHWLGCQMVIKLGRWVPCDYEHLLRENLPKVSHGAPLLRTAGVTVALGVFIHQITSRHYHHPFSVDTCKFMTSSHFKNEVCHLYARKSKFHFPTLRTQFKIKMSKDTRKICPFGLPLEL